MLLVAACGIARAGEPIVITGDEQRQLDLSLPGGGLPLAPGVSSIQVFRASRAAPELTDQKGWTYHHHVDLAAWRGKLYVAWDSCEKDEDVWPSRELYSSSSDGITWSPPAELFPQGVSWASRMYFFHAPVGRMLAIAGLRSSNDTLTERKKGAFVVREIRADHSLGDVYVLLRPAQPVSDVPPMFRESADRSFVQACEQLLANVPFLEQADYGLAAGKRKMKWHDASVWPADEPSRDHFPNRFGKAMCFYHRKDGALVAVMKWGWVMVSLDEGKTWSTPVRPSTLVAGMAKTWGQRTSDGRYALLYNPDLLKRHPLVVMTGDDGITFGGMRALHAELPSIRYPGLYKSPGPQYVRGISEWSSDGSWKDTATWVCYSMNKEDIWVSRIPVGSEASDWNLYGPRWAVARIESDVVYLEDRDPCDYAKAVRAIRSSSKSISFEVKSDGEMSSPLLVELDSRGKRLSHLAIEANSTWKPVQMDVGGADSISFRTGNRRELAASVRDAPIAPSRFAIRNIAVAH